MARQSHKKIYPLSLALLLAGLPISSAQSVSKEKPFTGAGDMAQIATTQSGEWGDVLQLAEDAVARTDMGEIDLSVPTVSSTRISMDSGETIELASDQTSLSDVCASDVVELNVPDVVGGPGVLFPDACSFLNWLQLDVGAEERQLIEAAIASGELTGFLPEISPEQLATPSEALVEEVLDAIQEVGIQVNQTSWVE